MQKKASILEEPRHWLPLMLPGTEGSSIKVYKIDEVNHRAVLKVRFDPGTSMPRQFLHCYAVAYTIRGSWTCDEGSFQAGDAAYGFPGSDLSPSSHEGTEIMIIFDSTTTQYIDNIMPDCTVLQLSERWLKALEGITVDEYRQLDQMSLIDLIPEEHKVN